MDQEVITNNNLIKEVFFREISQPTENLLNRNRQFFFHRVSQCFKRSGIRNFKIPETPDLENLVQAKDELKNKIEKTEIKMKPITSINLGQNIAMDKGDTVLPRYFLNGPEVLREIEGNSGGIKNIPNSENFEKSENNHSKKENSGSLQNEIIKNKISDIAGLDHCVQNARDQFDLNEKRLINFLEYLENYYLSCNRNCQFEIETTFKECINFCQNSYLKLLYDIRQG